MSDAPSGRPTAGPTDRGEPGRDGTAHATVPWGVQVAAAWSWRILVILAGLVALVLFLGYAKVLWVPVVIAVLLTVLLTPVVDLLQSRLRFPRALAAATAVVGLLALVGGLLTLAGRELVQGFADLWAQAAAGLETLTQYIADGPLGLDAEEVDSYLDQATAQIGENTAAILSGALSVTTTIVHVLVGAVITVFCLIFFLKDGAMIWAWLLRLLPSPARAPVYEASRRGWLTLTSYTRAQILVAFVDAVGIGVGAAILGLPLVIPLAVLVFLAAFIPFVGAIVTGAIAVLVALVDQGLGTAVAMFFVVLAVQQLESNVLEPLLLGHAVSLHPVAVLLVVTAGSISAGIVGALLAVPVTATLNTVVLYLRGRDKFPDLGSDAGGLARQIDHLDDVTNASAHGPGEADDRPPAEQP